MFKRKRLWIIPIVVAMVAVIGVFAIPRLVHGVQSSGDLANAYREWCNSSYEEAIEGQVVGQIVESNAEERARGETWHWIISPEQKEMANEILEQNPGIMTSEMLQKIAPEVIQRLQEEFPHGVPDLSSSVKWLPCMEKISVGLDPSGKGGTFDIGLAAEANVLEFLKEKLQEEVAAKGICHCSDISLDGSYRVFAALSSRF